MPSEQSGPSLRGNGLDDRRNGGVPSEDDESLVEEGPEVRVLVRLLLKKRLITEDEWAQELGAAAIP